MKTSLPYTLFSPFGFAVIIGGSSFLVWVVATIAAPKLKLMADITGCIASPIECVSSRFTKPASIQSVPVPAVVVTPPVATPPQEHQEYDWEQEYLEICEKTGVVEDCPTESR